MFLLIAKSFFLKEILVMNGKKDLDKSTLYEAVKTLVESPSKHIHLDQQKLFTLFSIAFQYILFRSTKHPGHYIIRIEDTLLAEKLARKAKDETTRKFLSRLIVPRRLAYGNSTFHLDYFPLATWGITKDLPKEKIQGAIIIKNTSHNPLIDESDFRHVTLDEQAIELFGKDYYLSSLMDIAPRTITIAFDEEFEGLEPIRFDFIEEKSERYVDGVRISGDVNFEED
jgi:transposase-like protein